MFVIVWLARRLIVIALLLAIPLVAGELIARKLVGDTVRSQVAARFGGTPSVGYGSTPLLEQLVEGRLTLNISEPNARISGLPPVALAASLTDIRLTSLLGLHGVIGSISATASLGPSGAWRLLASSGCGSALPPSVAAAMTRRPRIAIGGGHLSLLARHGRAVLARVVPTALGERIAFNVVSIAGRRGAATATGAGCVASLGGLPFNLTLTSASAADGMLRLAFTGRGARFAG